MREDRHTQGGLPEPPAATGSSGNNFPVDLSLRTTQVIAP